MEDRALIRRLVADAVPKSRIATQLGIARTTVYSAAESIEPPRYERSPSQTAFSPYELSVGPLLWEYPGMAATVIAERVGWRGSSSWFGQNVSRLRPEYVPKDPADRLCHPPGAQIQCGPWFPPVKVPFSATESVSPPVLVMVTCYSRFLCAVMLPSRRTCDLVAGTWMLLEGSFGAAPPPAALGQRSRDRAARQAGGRSGELGGHPCHQAYPGQAVGPETEGIAE